MSYQILAKVYSRLRQLKAQAIALSYQLLPKIWFRRQGKNCHFYGLPRFGYGFRNITLGDHCSLGVGIFLNCGADSQITIGDDVGINDYAYISALYGIQIGNNTRIGEFVSIRDNDHRYEDPSQPIYRQGFIGHPITIGSDVWIGRGVYIGKGITIGNGAVIGANTVVTKSIPPFAVAVGNPARVIKYRQGSEIACTV